jgi:protein-glutamine gamma-glutamyltransferase
VALLAILATIWYAGAAQQNGTAYLLAFLIGSVVLVSWLHARQHLAAVSVMAGSLPSARAGTHSSLPLTLTTTGGLPPTGIEVTSPLARQSVFVEQISADAPASITLSLKTDHAGVHGEVPVVIRSRYPLGFFTTEKVLRIQKPQLIHPKPRGDLPLPPATAGSNHRVESAASASSPTALGGDDFNGVSAWSPGDSLRHVDWKAVARGRPMMVKKFTGHSHDEVALAWDQVEGDDETRASQLAQWIDEAESKGLRWSLNLPGAKLSAGSGGEHRRQGLDALSRSISSTTAHATQAERSRLTSPTLETSAHAPGRPLALLTLTAALLAMPLMGAVPAAGPIVFFLAVIMRWWLGRRGPLSIWWRLTLVGCGLLGVWAQTGSLRGLEQGIAFMLMLTGGKVMESRTPRDLQVLVLLEWFLCLCALVLEQNLLRTLYVGAVALIILVCLVRMRRGTAGMKPPLRTTTVLALQAAPLVLVLFFFFPRGSGGLVTSLTRSIQSETGFSDELSPGSMAKVAMSDVPAFRATITQGSIDNTELYWRCFTLVDCQGLVWRRGPMIGAYPPVKPIREGIRQLISLEPHGGTWLPALDRPVQFIRWGRDFSIETMDRSLRAESPIRFTKRYEVESDPTAGQQDLSNSMKVACLRLPLSVSPQARALVASWAKPGTSPSAIVKSALDHFRTQGFSYTLEPGSYSGDGMNEFLFERKLGFCEHFAASFATLMRLAGIPSRVVVGYLGGEPFGDYYMVRQYNAHAWTEVYLEGTGWKRVDPTAELAPTRLTPDFYSLMGESIGSGFNIPRNTWWGRALLEVRMRWDNLNYQWFSRVVQFNEDEQFLLFDSWGLSSMKRAAAVGLGSLVVITLLLWMWLRRPAQAMDPAVRLWEKTCARLAKMGFPKGIAEGPLAYSQRVPALGAFAQLYIDHQYGSRLVDLASLRREAGKSLARVKKQLRS